MKGFRQIVFSLFFSFVCILYAYAIEDLELFYLPVGELSSVQGQSRTVMDNKFFILISPVLASEQINNELEHFDFNPDITLEELSFTRLENESLICPFYTGRTDSLNLELSDYVLKPPFYLEVIEKEKEIFKVSLRGVSEGDISFLVKDRGIYNLKGEFQGTFVNFKWADQRFQIKVSGFEESLKISIRPLDQNIRPRISYIRDFNLGDLNGEYSLDFENGRPYLDILFGKECAGLSFDSEALSILLKLDIPFGSSKK